MGSYIKMKGIVNRGLDVSQAFRQRQIVQPKAKRKVIIAPHHHHFFYYYNIRSVCCIELGSAWEDSLRTRKTTKELLDQQSRAPFLEAPGNYWAVKMFCFPFQMGVSKVLKIIQQDISKRSKMNFIRADTLEHTLIFLRLWFQNMILDPLSYRDFWKTDTRS